MADNDELDIKISELDAASDIDPAVDYLVVSKTSSIYTTGHKSFKATPNQVMASAGIGTLEGLSDVDLSSPTNGQVLKYNGTDWVNSAEASGATDLDELTDVTLTSPTSGQVLKYDGSKWVNGAGGSAVGGLDDLSDVDITTPTDGQALIYDANSSTWVNGAGGGGSSTLSGLTDVTITTPSNNQVLKYDSIAGKWVNGTGGGGGASALDDLSDVAITSATNDDSLVYNSTDGEWQNKPITKSLTQAEYDALVSGGTVDPNITYFITDGLPNGQMHNYSLAEHIVGSWIDGSIVYEKVCTGTTNQDTAPVLVEGVDKIISVTGYAGVYSIPAIELDNNRRYITVVISSGNAKLFTMGSNYAGLTFEIVLRYVKSSS